MSSFSINPERVQTVDMVSYFSAGTSVGGQVGQPRQHQRRTTCAARPSACRPARCRSTTSPRATRSARPTGKPAIQVTELQAQTDVTLALTANRVVAMLADSPIVDYAAKTTEGAVEAVGQPYDTAPYGIVLNKGQERLRAGRPGRRAVADATTAPTWRSWTSTEWRTARSRAPRSTRRLTMAHRRTTRPRTGPGRPPHGRRPRAPIKAVPVRHPGRWVAIAVLAVLGGDARQHDADQRRVPLGRRRPVPVLRAGAQRAEEHADPHRAVDAHRHRRRHRAGDHAAVAEPGAQLRRRALHLAVPRHAADRPAAVLELPGRALPAAVAGHPVRAGVRLVRHEPADQPVHGLPARARAQRGRVHGRDRARRPAVGRPRAERGGRRAGHVAGARRCAGSCCRRPCG